MKIKIYLLLIAVATAALVFLARAQTLDDHALNIQKTYYLAQIAAVTPPNLTYLGDNALASLQVTYLAMISTNGVGSATNAVSQILTNGVQLLSQATALDLIAGANMTITGTNGGATAHLVLASTGGGGSGAPLNGTNVWTGTNNFTGTVILTNVANQFAGAFTGNGAGVSNVNQLSAGSPSGALYPGTNVSVYLGTNESFIVSGQNNGTNTPLIRANWVSVPGKWYFDIGVQNPGANAGQGIKDCHFYMENSYFFDLFDVTKNLFLRFTSNGSTPHKDADGNIYGDVLASYSGGGFAGVSYPIWDYGANIFPTHIESQQTPFTAAAPIITVRTNAAGTTGTASNQSLDTDSAQQITVVPNGSGISVGILFTNTYDQLYDTSKRVPLVVFSAANSNAAATSVSVYVFSTSVSNYTFATSSSLTSGKSYIWNFITIQ